MALSYIAAEAENVGKKFWRLTALQSAGRDEHSRQRYWDFACECGEITCVPLNKVQKGVIRSCGCIEREADAILSRPTQLDDFITQHGGYKNELVVSRLSAITTNYERHVVNTAPTIIDGWLNDEESDLYWWGRQIRVIDHARHLWSDLCRPQNPVRTDLYLDDDSDGLDAERAKAVLRNARNVVGADRWRAFEMVIRWNEPGGFSGSRLVDLTDERRIEVRNLVYDVTEELAQSLVL